MGFKGSVNSIYLKYVMYVLYTTIRSPIIVLLTSWITMCQCACRGGGTTKYHFRYTFLKCISEMVF